MNDITLLSGCLFLVCVGLNVYCAFVWIRAAESNKVLAVFILSSQRMNKMKLSELEGAIDGVKDSMSEMRGQ